MAENWELVHQDLKGTLWRLPLGGQRGWIYRYDPATGSPSIAYEPA